MGGRRTRSTQDRDGQRRAAEGLPDDPLHPRTRTRVDLALEQTSLATSVRDLVPGPVDGAERERGRVRQGRVEVVVWCQEVGLGEAVVRVDGRRRRRVSKRKGAGEEEDKEEEGEEGDQAWWEAWIVWSRRK